MLFCMLISFCMKTRAFLHLEMFDRSKWATGDHELKYKAGDALRHSAQQL